MPFDALLKKSVTNLVTLIIRKLSRRTLLVTTLVNVCALNHTIFGGMAAASQAELEEKKLDYICIPISSDHHALTAQKASLQPSDALQWPELESEVAMTILTPPPAQQLLHLGAEAGIRSAATIANSSAFSWQTLCSKLRATHISWKAAAAGATLGLIISGATGVCGAVLYTLNAQGLSYDGDATSPGLGALEGFVMAGPAGAVVGALVSIAADLHPALKEALAEKNITIKIPCGPLQRFGVEADDSCPICRLEYLGEHGDEPTAPLLIVRPPCRHEICSGCYEKMLHSRLPKLCCICRADIPTCGEIDVFEPKLITDIESQNHHDIEDITNF